MVRHAAVLRALIRVMNEPGCTAPLADGHGEGIERQLLIRLGPHGPADHPPRIQIQEHRHIEPPGSGRRRHGHITDPDAC